MNREQIENAIEEWHEMYEEGEDSVVELHDVLGLTWTEYSLYVEWDILPGEEIPVEKFLQLRSDMIRYADDADRYLTENKRYREALSEIRFMTDPDEDSIKDVLDRNNV
ncbi:hypothetical protein SEA_TOMAS_34 [Streptomyces phage Tomas]|uniref:Uncharacterized protein n=1 Tax=Streptomyces phage Tomas TaxID=2914443 RepID=A0AA49BUZ4_9CAUD|nr:hypothetical protein PP453_gp034 [Streptomyces phage Tomas]UMO76224.1 hypothetical protein SEA_TOMAS_34 [Streptomyces phage Tomas]